MTEGLMFADCAASNLFHTPIYRSAEFAKVTMHVIRIFYLGITKSLGLERVLLQ
jgi:hypothetical protein